MTRKVTVRPAATVDLLERLHRRIAPLLDLFARVVLAKTFFVSGMSKIASWDVALELARHEYPVPWLSPELAALAGAATEVGGALLLTAGLAVRPAALALLCLSLVIQFEYQRLDINLLWAALFGWYVLNGAGPLSLDHLLSKGLATSALPGAARVIRISHWIGRTLGPCYSLLVRFWLGLSLLGWGAFAAAFPLATFAPLPSLAAIPAAALLAFGLATRITVSTTAVMLLIFSYAAAPQAAVAYGVLLLLFLLVYGPGSLSVDHLLSTAAARMSRQPPGPEPNVVIVGAGFGGMACARALQRQPVRITLVDRRNYFLFQPLLYQVATASLSPGDIATPIRSAFRADPRLAVLYGTASAVDPTRQTVTVDGKEHGYDYLILATGASHGYFGNDRWAALAPGLKFIEDALDVRSRILAAFEQAEAADDPDERQRLLTFLVVGGGPTGVELAGAIADLARLGLQGEFRSIDPGAARIGLIQAGPRLLPSFPENLSEFARISLEQLGVEIMLNSRVETIDQVGVVVNGHRIAAATVLWAAGVTASPAAKWLHRPGDRAGRLEVGADLSVPGWTNVFAIGDTATSHSWNGMPMPGLAPAAKQAGAYVASVIGAQLKKKHAPAPFAYRHRGSLATIGRKSAVADFGWMTLTGVPAWWLWGAVHVFSLVGLRNRISVFFGWLWCYVTYRVGFRLIIGTAVTSADGPSRDLPTSGAGE